MNSLNVPQLRFPGFDGEWESKTLFDISKEVSYGMNAAAKTFDGIHKYIRITDIDSDSRKFNPNPLTSPEGDIDERFKLRINDIVFTRTGASVGKSYLYNEEDGALYYAGFLIKFSITNANSYFVFCQTLKESYDKWVQVNSMRSGQPGLNAEEYKSLNISIPTLPEQQKIASFLSAVNEKIQQLSRKNELLEQYKKGVMQQLFSGKLRFKHDNGKDYPDWEEKKLGEVAKYYDGTHQTPNYVEAGIPFYSVEHVTANQFLKSKFISEEVFEKENKRVKLEKGDILMTRIGDIGTSRLIDWDVKASFYVSLALIKQNDNYNSSFLNQYISSVNFQKELWENTIHVAFPKKINLGEIGKCKISFPSLPEQQKIANFLSGIDGKIEQVNGELVKTQEFKKGLLQQMFV